MKKRHHAKNENQIKVKYLEPLTYESDIEIKEEFSKVFIPDYGMVEINNLGTKVYTKTGKFPSIYDEGGYLMFNVGTTQGHRNVMKYHTLRIHRLVALAFIPNPDNLPEVNHKDGNKKNNCVTNLEWVSGLENLQHAWNTGLIYGLKGQENGRSKLNDEQVKEIRNKYTGKKGEIAQLAREYNVSWTLIKFIVTNKNWTHVK